jgi:hypothetical protein
MSSVPNAETVILPFLLLCLRHSEICQRRLHLQTEYSFWNGPCSFFIG